jgi:hypothetical protein
MNKLTNEHDIMMCVMAPVTVMLLHKKLHLAHVARSSTKESMMTM